MAEVLRGNLDLAGELTEVVLNALSLMVIIVGVIASMIEKLDAVRWLQVVLKTYPALESAVDRASPIAIVRVV